LLSLYGQNSGSYWGGRVLHFMACVRGCTAYSGPTTDDSYQDHGPQQQPNNIATYIKRNHQIDGEAFLAWVTRCISFLGLIQDILIFADTEHNNRLNLSQNLYHDGHMAAAIRWHVCNIFDKASHVHERENGLCS
jgi:hypothetical protein